MQKTQLLTPIIGIVAFAFIFSACAAKTPTTQTASPTSAAMEKIDDETAESPDDEKFEQTNTTPAPTVETVMKTEKTAKGNSLTETETYMSPAGPEQVGFTLVVDSKGVIVDAKTEELGKAPTSKVRQAAFAKEMPTVIVGKKLSDLTKVDRIGGSSLTTGAFNKFLENAKKQS